MAKLKTYKSHIQVNYMYSLIIKLGILTIHPVWIEVCWSTNSLDYDRFSEVGLCIDQKLHTFKQSLGRDAKKICFIF